MRDVVLLVAVVAVLPLCVYRPWIGVLAWSWLGYMNPHRLTWDFAYAFPFAQLVAAATLLGVVWHVFQRRELRSMFAGAELKLLLLLWGIFAATSYLAIDPDNVDCRA